MKIRFATSADSQTISDLAHQIWPATYADVISEEQITFMLAQTYTTESIKLQIDDGHVFFILESDGIAQGFASLSKENSCNHKLQKLYIHQNLQGQGAGKMMLTAIEDYCKSNGASNLILNVNRNNRAQHFYQKMGYRIIETVDLPYHQFILNDYVMSKTMA